MKPHKHAELIKAWADGADIQVRMLNSGKGWTEWEDHPFPCWTTSGRIHFEYRIKPTPKPDVVEDVFVWKSPMDGYPMMVRHDIPNLRLIFDGESGLFKDVEVIND